MQIYSLKMFSAFILIASVVVVTPTMAQTSAPKPPSETVTDRDLICAVSGNSFVLGAADFKVLSEFGITSSTFKTQSPKKKAQICSTRYVARLIAAGKLTKNDLEKNEQFLPMLLSDDELKVANPLIEGLLDDALAKNKRR